MPFPPLALLLWCPPQPKNNNSQLVFVLVDVGLVGLVDKAAAIGTIGAVDAGLCPHPTALAFACHFASY